MPTPNGGSIAALDMITSNDGWAVGSDGCILHWDGKNWNNVASPTTVWLSCVDMVSSTDGWIAGADGLYRWQSARAKVDGFSIDYLMIIIAVIVVTVFVWFLIRNRIIKIRPRSRFNAT